VNAAHPLCEHGAHITHIITEQEERTSCKHGNGHVQLPASQPSKGMNHFVYLYTRQMTLVDEQLDHLVDRLNTSTMPCLYSVHQGGFAGEYPVG
jgi:hypothetical protein